jgi:hypothetical protein
MAIGWSRSAHSVTLVFSFLPAVAITPRGETIISATFFCSGWAICLPVAASRNSTAPFMSTTRTPG